MADISVFTVVRIFHSVWRGLAFIVKKPYVAFRYVQSLKWWGLCWDFSGFLGMFAEGSGPVYITCLQGFGTNKSKLPIHKISGYIESDITGFRLPLTMEGMAPEETNGVPAKCRFFIQALFRDPTSPREGIEEEKFLQAWSDFTFVFTADGRQQKYRFGRREVIGCINEFSRPLKRLPTPTITRRAAQ